MNAQELLALSQRLNQHCQRAEQMLEQSPLSPTPLIEELRAHLRRLQQATDTTAS